MMNKIKKTIVMLVLSLFALASVFADGQWWQGKAITDFEYEGLVNVKQSTLDSLLQPYVGESYSDELFSEIYGKLYAQSYIETVLGAEALAGGASGEDLVIRFTFIENPMISSVSVEGAESISKNTLLSKQNYSKGDFVNSNDLSANSALIEDYYRSKGYKDVVVTAESKLDKDTNTQQIVYRVVEGSQYKVRSILFEGLTAFNAKDLKKILASSEKSFFNSGNYIDVNLETDRSNLLQYYATNGYIDAKITDIKVNNVTTEEDKLEYLEIVYVLDEGEQSYYGDITFSGNEVYSDEEIAEILAIEKGSLHNTEVLTKKLTNLSSLYYDNGYIYCQIIPTQTVVDGNVINYHIEIVEGQQAIIEEIIIDGLTKTKPYVFYRELTVHVGEVFNREAFIKSQQNIYNTGIVKSVNAQLLPGSTTDTVVLLLEIEEGNQVELQFGATFGGTVEGFPISGFLQWSDKNLAGTGRDLSINTTLSPDTQNATISLSDDWVGNYRWSNGISISAERSVKVNQLQRGQYSDYYDGRDSEHKTYPLGFANAEDYWNSSVSNPGSEYLMNYDYYRIALGYNTGYTFTFQPGNLSLTGGISIGLNHAVYDSTKYDPYDLLIHKYGQKWQFANRISLGLTWDGRDLKTNTSRGYLLSMGYTYAGGILGGLSNYNKLSFNGAFYHSIFSHEDEDGRSKHLVLSLSSNVSFMFDQFWKKDGVWGLYDARQGATKYEMLYIDGMNIGRGFSPITDKSFLWHNQIELSYPLVMDVLSVEGFASGTGVTNTLDELSSFGNIDWYFAFGAGIRMRIPGFPLGLYLVKNATYGIDNNGFEWDSGYIFGTGQDDGRGLKLVLAITTSIY